MKNIKSSLKKDINSNLKSVNAAYSAEEKTKFLCVIAKEIAIYNNIEKEEIEKLKSSEQLKSEKLKAKKESERQSFERKIKLKEMSIKEKELDLKEHQINLEDKKEDEAALDKRNKLAEDIKASKRNLIVSIIGIAVPALITIGGKIAYTCLAVNAQKHDYKDYVMESGYSKEQRNNLLK